MFVHQLESKLGSCQKSTSEELRISSCSS